MHRGEVHGRGIVHCVRGLGGNISRIAWRCIAKCVDFDQRTVLYSGYGGFSPAVGGLNQKDGGYGSIWRDASRPPISSVRLVWSVHSWIRRVAPHLGVALDEDSNPEVVVVHHVGGDACATHKVQSTGSAVCTEGRGTVWVWCTVSCVWP